MTYKWCVKIETERLATRIRREDKRLIEKAAAMSGISVSAFIKMRLREAAIKVLEEEQVIRLNAEESLRFAKILLAPPRKLPEAFSEAMRLHDELVEER